MDVCLLTRDGELRVPRQLNASPEAWRHTIAPERDALAMAVEWMCAWYGLADLGAQEGIPFGLGHALSMTASHGGQTQNAKRDAPKMAVWLRGGMLPQAYGYPAERRATRDLLRRRMSLLRQRAALLAHGHNTTRQYNRPESGHKRASRAPRTGGADRFPEPRVRKTVDVALQWIDSDDARLRKVELSLVELAKHHEVQTVYRLRSMPGVGKLRALGLLDASHASTRVPRGQACVSSARLVQGPREAAGKRAGPGGPKSGNVPRQWAFSEAAGLFLRNHPRGQAHLAKLARRPGNAKALSILAQHLSRAVSCMRKRHEAVDMHTLLAT
jgi:transposase